MTWTDILSGIRRSIDEKIAEELKRLEAPDTLYGPVKYAIGSGGKRLRPILLVSACRWAGGSTKQALDAAYAMELFHNFTLVHDDIMDEAMLRRGQDSVHHRFGQNAALLAGDVMLTLSHQAMARAAEQVDDFTILRLYDEMSVSICEGQQLDSDAEQSSIISVENYLEIIEKKTAVLLASCLQIGALVGGAGSESAELLRKYGMMTGMAFQIQDDLLDVYGTSERTGKEVGGDILMNKKTYLYLRTLQKASEDDRENLLNLFSQDDPSLEGQDKVKQVMEIYRAYDVKKDAIQLKEEYLQRAVDSLAQLPRQGRSLDLLKYLGNQLIYRSS